MDITTTWDVANGRGDWSLSGGQLLTGNDLATAVIISLFTDRLAATDDVIPDGTGDPRGWWGDMDEDRPIGSRLWLLDRAKQTPETLRRAHDYAVEALQWLKDDGVATRVDVYAEWSAPSMLGIKVTVWRADGTNVASNFTWAWGA